jgi:glycosyltransferase involved in cell wall biosynthesis
MIVGLFPELASLGGVQRAGRLTAAALASYAARSGQPWRFLSLNDPPQASPLTVGPQGIAFSGCGRSKVSFFLAAWVAARKQPSLIVALHPNLAPVVAAMKVRAPAARVVIFAHGIEVWTPLPFVRRRSLQTANLVFAPSADTARQLSAQQGLPQGKVRRLPWSLGPEVDLSASVPTGSHLPEGFPRGRVILTVGRWDAREAYKGLDHLILVMPRLLHSVPDLHLVAIGSGTDVPRLKQLAQNSGVAARVYFLNGLPQEQLAPAYESSDVFALPSCGEGFGLVFLEAMSHGKPVIGGAHGGTPDVVEDGVTGYLVRYGDMDQLSNRLERLLCNDALRRDMGARALARVRQDFTFDRFSRDLSAALENLENRSCTASSANAEQREKLY